MIRRIECVLIEKRQELAEIVKAETPNLDAETFQKRCKIRETNEPFYNRTDWTLKKILAESSSQVEANFRTYLNGFSDNIQEIIDKFDFRSTLKKMIEVKRLYTIIELVADEDLSPRLIKTPPTRTNISMNFWRKKLIIKSSNC